MKKLLFLIFIVLIFLNDSTADMSESCKEAFQKQTIKVIDWLKKNGIQDPVVSAFKQGGAKLASKICEKIFLEECCPAFINFLIKNSSSL